MGRMYAYVFKYVHFYNKVYFTTKVYMYFLSFLYSPPISWNGNMEILTTFWSNYFLNINIK